jgi:hypothetical protein
MIESLQHIHRLYKCLQYLYPNLASNRPVHPKRVCRYRVSVFIGFSGIRFDFETNNTVIRQSNLCRHSPIINLSNYNMSADDSVISITSCLNLVTNVDSSPRFRIFRCDPLRYSIKAAPLLLVLVLPHIT